ncbi:MAG: hypothetical protein LBL73_11110 [Synergistaceae bacterium]|nr:hypothetical protein [Synergistaceae bacterium]
MNGDDSAIIENTADDQNKERMDRDSMWKDLIKKFFPYLLKRAIPELYGEADLSAEPKFLDKEFRDILNTSDPEIHKSPNFADYVLEVPLKNGEDEWVILHIEQQGPQGGNLPDRMNHYRCFIVVHYRREPVALAIITGGHKREKRSYSHSRFGTKSNYEYNSLAVEELDDDELLASDNPMDLAFYAAKCALRSKGELQKYNYLRTLAGLLAGRGWNPEEKRDLLLFIERIIYVADRKLAEKYREYRRQLGEEGKMMYIPFYELDAAEEVEKRGIEKGKLEGKLEVARNLLASGVSPDIIAKSAGLPQEKIRELMN